MTSGPIAAALSLVLLAAVLAFATAAPRGLPEALVAVPAAGVALLSGVVSPAAAGTQIAGILPTVGFLAAILLLAHLAGVEGVFDWLGSRMAMACRGSPRRLLVLTFVTAAGTTAMLSLDATVVLLTPVVLSTAGGHGLHGKAPAYACGHLANSASTLLPVSNLTNLLVFSASGLTFASFAATMALPWLVTVLIELAIFLWFFRSELRGGSTLDHANPPEQRRPTFALAVMGLTLVLFGLTPVLGIAPGLIAAGAGAVLACRSLALGKARPTALVLAAGPWLCLFVLALAVVVEAASEQLLGGALHSILPSSSGLAQLVVATLIAAALANLVNNLPATLLLLAALGPRPDTPVLLAVLLGVNIGPNLSYLGSLANLLWRGVLRRAGQAPRARELLTLGLCTVPLCLLGSVLALWGGLALTS